MEQPSRGSKASTLAFKADEELFEDVGTLITRFARREALAFRVFLDIWESMHFAHIHYARPAGEDVPRFEIRLMTLAMAFVTSVRGFYYQLGGAYAVYCIHATQFLRPRMPARATVDEWKALLSVLERVIKAGEKEGTAALSRLWGTDQRPPALLFVHAHSVLEAEHVHKAPAPTVAQPAAGAAEGMAKPLAAVERVAYEAMGNLRHLTRTAEAYQRARERLGLKDESGPLSHVTHMHKRLDRLRAPPERDLSDAPGAAPTEAAPTPPAQGGTAGEGRATGFPASLPADQTTAAPCHRAVALDQATGAVAVVAGTTTPLTTGPCERVAPVPVEPSGGAAIGWPVKPSALPARTVRSIGGMTCAKAWPIGQSPSQLPSLSAPGAQTREGPAVNGAAERDVGGHPAMVEGAHPRVGLASPGQDEDGVEEFVALARDGASPRGGEPAPAAAGLRWVAPSSRVTPADIDGHIPSALQQTYHTQTASEAVLPIEEDSDEVPDEED